MMEKIPSGAIPCLGDISGSSKENVCAYLSVNTHWLAAALMVWRALATEEGGTDDTRSTATVGWVATGARLVPSATNNSVGLFQVISSQTSVCSPCDREEGSQSKCLSQLSLYHLERPQCPSQSSSKATCLCWNVILVGHHGDAELLALPVLWTPHCRNTVILMLPPFQIFVISVCIFLMSNNENQCSQVCSCWKLLLLSVPSSSKAWFHIQVERLTSLWTAVHTGISPEHCRDLSWPPRRKQRHWEQFGDT